MRRFIFLAVSCFALFSGCKKDQPIPSQLQGYWHLAKTVNVAYQTTTVGATGSCLHFTDKAFSTACKKGQQESGHRYTFTPNANDPTKGTLKFEGKKMDPDTYTISFVGDTLVLTPPSLVYDIKYYVQ